VTGREQASLLLRRAAEDEALVDEVIDSPNVSDAVIGFHCQQVAEKLLKAALAAIDVPYPWTHDIRRLILMLEDAGHPLA
jgi:HEPN domain-containing protein